MSNSATRTSSPVNRKPVSQEWDRKIGWIVPSRGTVTEYEVARLTAPNVSNHFARISHSEDTVEAFARMADEAPEVADLLTDAGVDAIGYACTAGSFFRGRAEDQRFRDSLEQRTGQPVVTMADSLVRAANHLDLQRLSLAAPYETWLLDLLANYLEEAGFEVIATSGLGEQANVKHGLTTTLDLARSAHDPKADGMIISCGNFRTLEVIDAIEEELGIPTITSIQAAVWAIHVEIDAEPLEAAPGSLFAPDSRSRSKQEEQQRSG